MTPADREELRRRLYRPAADGAAVQAYLALEDGGPGSRDPRPSPHPGALPARRASAAIAAVVAVLGTAALLVAVRGAGTEAVPRAAATASALPSAAVPPLPTVAVDAPTRFVLVQDLLSDHDAGLGTWLRRRSGADPAAGRFTETHGSGDAVVTIPGTAADGGGRLTVLLVLAQDGAAGWTTARLVLHPDRTIHLSPTSQRFGGLRAGVPAIGRLDFTASSRPVRLLVSAPADAAWGVAVLTSR